MQARTTELEGAQLGPFTLQAHRARGGTADVWRAVDSSNQPAAVKILRLEDGIAQPSDFLVEVRALAQLDHPFVVQVLDHGSLDRPLGSLPAGSPWVAMEWLAGRRLSSWVGKADFAAVATMTWQLLSGLAHCHARRVLHLDLKPGNVLLVPSARGAGTRPEDQPTPVLIDFGIGLEGERPQSGRVAGTPGYMAPEQCLGEWRRYGPATDLYAVGCMVWRLLCGEPPFGRGRRGDPIAVMQAQILEPPPPFEPQVEVPPGVEAWLLQLLEKRPADRFSSAAAARAELAAFLPEELSYTLEETTAHLVPRAPRRDRWSAGAVPRQPAGRSLFGIREQPLVGRERERQELWQRLVKVATSHQPQLTFLAGASGCGKSRLARWLARTAEEEGLARSLWVDHTAGGGLRLSLRRHFRAWGLSGQELSQQLGEHLPEAEAQALTLALEQGGSGKQVRAAVQDALLTLSDNEPLIVVLDDLQWGMESFGVIRRLLRCERPLLMLGTLRDDALMASPDAQRAVEDLLAQPHTRSIWLDPLGSDDIDALIGGGIRLAPELRTELVQRAAGSPLFAMQLVGDLVQQGKLRAGPEGYALVPGARPSLPEDLQQSWLRRVQRTLRPDELEAVCLAACFEGDVLRREWRAACGARALTVATDLERRLAHQRLILPFRGEEPGFRFVHGMLRECLLAESQRQGWRAAHHRTIAALPLPPGSWRALARRGRHLKAAGGPQDAQDALDALAQAAFRAIDDREFDASEVVLGEAAPLCRAATGTAALGVYQAASGALAARRHAYREAESAFTALCSTAAALGDDWWRSYGLARRAEVLAQHLKQPERGRQLAREALALCAPHRRTRSHHWRTGEARVRHHVGQTWIALGDDEGGCAHLRHAVDLATRTGDIKQQLTSLTSLGLNLIRRCREERLPPLIQSIEKLDPEGRYRDRYDLLLVHQLQKSGRHEQAARALEQRLERDRRRGDSTVFSSLNLARVLLDQGRLARVPGLLDATQKGPRPAQVDLITALLRAMLGASQGARAPTAEALEQARDLMRDVPSITGPIAETAEAVAARCAAWPRIEQEARLLAHELYMQVPLPAQARRVVRTQAPEPAEAL